MQTRDWIELEQAHSSGAVGRRPVVIVEARGAKLRDSDGREYIDCAAAHGWANVGHCHPLVTQAIQEQAARLVMHSESSGNDQRALWFGELAAVLRERFGSSAQGCLTRIHPCNSGAEAVEGALKLARCLTGRAGIVAARDGFHGRTMGALSTTWNPKYRKPFEPLLPAVTHVPYNDTEAMAEAIDENTGAVILEIVQGEGGVKPGGPAYFRKVRELCSDAGALLIIDEVQTGFGRTGKWFACEHTADGETGAGGVQPDIVALGKALGGGIPMAAFAWREGLGLFPPGAHGGTFGGNPLACAAGRAVLRILREEQLPERTARLGEWALRELRSLDLPVIREVRGLGLMIGIQLRSNVTPVLKALIERGIWALPAGPTVLRLLPPLVIEEEDLARAVKAVAEVLGGLSSGV